MSLLGLGLGGDEGEEAFTETGGADADAAAQVGEMLFAPHLLLTRLELFKFTQTEQKQKQQKKFEVFFRRCCVVSNRISWAVAAFLGLVPAAATLFCRKQTDLIKSVR